MDSKENSKIFNNIYRYNKWGFGSGTGSISFLNKPFINFVNGFMRRHKEIKTIVDIGCGDWQIGRHLELKGLKYIGCDVSDLIIKKTNKKFSRPGVDFLELDAVNDELPDGDLAIVKDVLMHLSNEDVSKILSKLAKYPYVVLQNSVFESNLLNKDIRSGRWWRSLDVTKAPFGYTDYNLVLSYTEGLVKPVNIIMKILGMAQIKKEIFLKS